MRIGVALPSRLGDGAPGGGLTQRDLIDLAVLADGVMLRITESLLPLVAGTSRELMTAGGEDLTVKSLGMPDAEARAAGRRQPRISIGGSRS